LTESPAFDCSQPNFAVLNLQLSRVVRVHTSQANGIGWRSKRITLLMARWLIQQILWYLEPTLALAAKVIIS